MLRALTHLPSRLVPDLQPTGKGETGGSAPASGKQPAHRECTEEVLRRFKSSKDYRFNLCPLHYDYFRRVTMVN